MRSKRRRAIFIVDMEWIEDNQKMMTGQIARDKMFTPLQELWILHILTKLSIEDVSDEPGIINKIIRENEKGERHSLYEKQPKVKKTAK